MALRFNFIALTILLFAIHGFGQTKSIIDKKTQSKFAKAESTLRCSCFKKIIKEDKKEDKRRERESVKADKNGAPIVMVGGFIHPDTLIARKRKSDLINFIDNLDSLSRVKFEKEVMKNIKSDCPKQLSEMKRIGYRPK